MSPKLRTKLTSLLFILPLVGGLGAVAYKFGPSPAGQVAQGEDNVAQAPEPPKTEPSLPDGGQLFSLFGISQTATGKGQVLSTPTEYLNSLEAIYLKRGYRKAEQFDPAKLKDKKRKKEPPLLKFFQRDETKGIGNISATGTDADYGSNEESLEPYTFTTIVTPAQNGASDWATYKMVIDRSKTDQLSKIIDGDFPGNDPTNIPRLSGLQRTYTLSSGAGTVAIYKSKLLSDDALMMKYLEEMPRYGWHLDSAASAEASKIASGVMCFTQGAHSSLIWVTAGRPNELANVTISSY